MIAPTGASATDSYLATFHSRLKVWRLAKVEGERLFASGQTVGGNLVDLSYATARKETVTQFVAFLSSLRRIVWPTCGRWAMALRRRSTLVVVAVALWSVTAALGATPAPLVKVTPTELLLREPAGPLAADGAHAAFAFCGELIGVWQPGAKTVVQLTAFPFPRNVWACPTPGPPPPVGSVFGLALAGREVAWIVETGGNVLQDTVDVADVLRPAAREFVASAQHVRDGGAGSQDPLGDLLGHGGLLVFGEQLKCYDSGAPACPPQATPATILSQTVWRIRPGTSSAACVAQPGACQQVAETDGPIVPLSVDAGRVALRQTNGTIAVLAAGGALVRVFPSLAGRASAVVLTPNSLVAFVPGTLLELSLATGTQLHSWPLPNLLSAGSCGREGPGCPTAPLRLLDAAHGFVAYLDRGRLRLLRLRDGRNATVHAATDARFGANGLFYSYTTSGAWPGRIVFVPWRALPLQP